MRADSEVGGGGGPDGSGKGLKRVLSSFDAAMLAVGIVVGTGIFAVPGFVARELGSPGWILLAWTVGGVVTLAGALTYAEMASLFPRQGGAYVYVLQAFGPFAAFFKGWGSFLFGFPASCAVVATIFGSYFAAATGWVGGERPAAVAAVVLVWQLNLRGTRFSGRLQTVVTLLKVGALGTIGMLALFASSADASRLSFSGGADWPGWRVFAAALVGVFWTYDGWGNLTVVAGEVVNPKRGLTRALLGTVAVVTSLYLLLNVGYLLLLPLEQLQQTDSAAAAVAESVLGPIGGRLLAAFVVISAFGTLFGISMSGPRYYWAMGEAGLFFKRAGRVDPSTGAPSWGATMLAVVTLVYLLSGTFGQIMGFYVAISGIYSALTIVAIFRLRGLTRDRKDVFRTPGYPIVPAIAAAALLWITVSEIMAEPIRTGLGVAGLFAAAPAYWIWRRRSPKDGVDA